MMEAVIKSSVILVVTLGALPLLRRQSAAMRHAVLAVGLICALGVPVVTPLVPAWPTEIARSRGLYARVQDPTEIFPILDAGIKPTATSSVQTSVVTPDRVLFWTWICGMVIAGILLFVGATRIALLTAQSKGVSWESAVVALAEISRALNLKRRVRLLQNDRSVLGTWGILRPRVLLPRDADNWPDDRLRVVLTHELAHIKRFDWLVQMLAELARAVCWFNPLFWIVCRKLRAQSELACDDVVLNLGIDARDYAAHLLELARTLKTSNRVWSPVLAMAQPPNLERRFVAMLNPSLNHRSVTRAAGAAVFLMALCITLPLAAMRAPEPAKPAVARFEVPVVTASAPAPRPAPAAAPVARKTPPSPKPAPAQAPAGGNLSGTVSDATGAVVPGVMVRITKQQVEMEMATDEAGRYNFAALPAGVYSLTAQLPGFATARIGSIEIKVSENFKQNVTLSVGGVSQKVTVSAPGQPKPAPFPGLPKRIRVGGNVQAPNLISQVKPAYPQSARDAGVEGIVHIQGIIAADGSLIGLRAVNNPDTDLTNAAIEAAKQWRYRPALLNNEPIEVPTELEVEFKLVQ